VKFDRQHRLSLHCLRSTRLNLTFVTSIERMANSTYPPEQTSDEIEHLVSLIKDWTIAHGLAVRPPPTIVRHEADPHGILATTAPVTLFPSPFPRVCFDQAQSIQEAYNELYAAIAQDEDFLKSIVEE
jgi:hypothetical protein